MATKSTKRKKESIAPRCVFCGRSGSGVTFAIFNPRFKPFGTACTDCEKSLPPGTPLPAPPAPAPEPAPEPLSYNDCVDCFATPKGEVIDPVHPVTGKGFYSNQTLEEIRSRRVGGYPTAQKMSLAQARKLKHERQNTPVTWSPVTEERYHEMLNVLPPACHGYGAFCVGEPHDSCAKTGWPRFAAYRIQDGIHQVASRPVTVAELSQIIGRPLENQYIS